MLTWRDGGRRAIAVSRCGRWTASRTSGGIELRAAGDAAPGALVGILDADASQDDFLCVGDELWIAGRGELRRYLMKSAAAVGAPTRLGTGDDADRGELRPLPGGSGALWDSRAAPSLLVGRRAQLAVLSLDGIPASELLIPLSHDRVLVGLGDRLGCYDRLHRSHRDLALFAGRRVLFAAPVLLGHAIAILTRSDHETVLHIHRPEGRRIHQLPLPPLAACALWPGPLGALALTTTATLLTIDTRLGRIAAETPAPPTTVDLATDEQGRTLLLATTDRHGDVTTLAASTAAAAVHASAPAPAPASTSAVLGSDPRSAPACNSDDFTEIEAADDASTPSVPEVSGTSAIPEPSVPEVSGTSGATPEVSGTSAAVLPSEGDGDVRGSDPEPAELEPAVVREVLEEALCHAVTLIERLVFVTQNLGLLPRTTTQEDPLGGLVVSDSDVATIVAGFKVIGSTVPEGRAGLLNDPFVERLAASRCGVRARLAAPRAAGTGLARIVATFALGDAALDMLLLALAPDWDLRVGRLFGFLNNDAAQLRPKAGHLVMAAQAGLPAPDGGIWRVLDELLGAGGLLARDSSPHTPRAAQTIRGVDAVVELSMTAVPPPPPETRGFAALRWPAEEKEGLRRILIRELGAPSRRPLVIEGPRGSGRLAMVRAAARDAAAGVEVCDLSRLADGDAAAIHRALGHAILRARICRRALAIRCEGVLRTGARTIFNMLESAAAAHVPCFVLALSGELEAIESARPILRLHPPRPSRLDLRALWSDAALARRLAIDEAALDDVAVRYRCPPGRVWELCDELALRQHTAPAAAPIAMREIRGAVRELTVERLSTLATRHDSGIALDDLELADEVRARLDEVVDRMRHRHRVLGTWAYADKVHESYGVSALFTGPAGTGKTAAAGAIANALEIDLYIVDFSRIMSKWVGETEQNLARVFDEAEASNVALLFDEADALFGKRSVEQKSSSDRYANLTVNYLLQRMESFSGLAILTTNLESALDDAFQRRITTKVRFPETDSEQRAALWRRMLPAGSSFGPDVDLSTLSADFELQGAHIRRALTRAAFRAAAHGSAHPVLGHRDLAAAASCEYEDMGRLAGTADDGPVVRLARPADTRRRVAAARGTQR